MTQPPLTQPPPRHLDHQLKASITRALEWAPDVNADHIGVSLTEGAVSLFGEVLTYPEKTAAIRAVLRVHGVTGIADELTVKHNWGTRPDGDIARDISTGLTSNVVLLSRGVKATVKDQWVTLTGEVSWNYEREAAGHVASNIAGVSGIHNRITLRPTLPFAAEDATVKVKEALIRNAQTDAGTIHVTAEGTELNLSGTVHSWSEFREAGDAAWATPGVTAVKNNLSVAS